MRKTAFSTAVAEVGRRDRVMANLIKRTSPFHLPRPSRGRWKGLVESILHQQLAGAAARAIHGRFVALFDGDLSPEAVLAVPSRKLRAAGLSGRKVASIRDLAAKVVDGTVPLDRIGRLADEDVITRLSVVRGIGQWTAEMFLIFQLRRTERWPRGIAGRPFASSVNSGSDMRREGPGGIPVGLDLRGDGSVSGTVCRGVVAASGDAGGRRTPRGVRGMRPGARAPACWKPAW